VLLLSACNGGEPDATPTTETTVAEGSGTVPPPPVSDIGRQLLEQPEAVLRGESLLSPEELAPTLAYIRAQQAWIRAGMAPVNPDHPDLAATTGGNVLENVRNALREKQARGQANQAPKVLKTTPKRIQVNPDSAWIVYCFTEQVPVYDVRSGQVVGDDMFSYDEFVELRSVEGRYTVVAREPQGSERQGDSCAA
jgi:hypothetical protein